MNFKAAYFIGVGGAGMSALARYFKKDSKLVYGYDKANTRLTDQLESEGIVINYSDSIESIPTEIISLSKDELLLVYTPAIPSNHNQLSHLKSLGHIPIKRAELLGKIIKNQSSLAVSGTHGKTSTTAILAHILDGTPSGCNAFLGGIAEATNTNLYHSKSAEWTVVEADEFDRSFHHLYPTHGLITSLDPDHLDIYKTHEAFIEGFRIFESQITDKTLVSSSLQSTFPCALSYGLTPNLDNYAYQILQTPSGTTCSLSLGNGSTKIRDISIPLFGEHNLENAVGAAALSHLAGASADIIKSRLESFPGIHRRFKIHVNKPSKVYIDDYAHHPTEIAKTIEAVRHHFPNRNLTVIFQPHLYSRTQDQLKGFCRELDKSDRVILLPIYPAREKPIKGVNTQLILDNISHTHAELSTKNSIFENLKAYSVDVILTLGAGDIDTLVPAIKDFASMDA
ncbi:MAG: UDP-N-acetylmuramate--L-alanine ligase [Crocinitomicaceae bacterium]|nr:UDP-N-acetylmuramate--L-alanine ligase [Crocinitomicaceae bacterium]